MEFMTPLEAREDAVAASIRDLSEMSERNAAAATRSVEDAGRTSRKSSDRRHRSASLKLESAKYIKCIVRVKRNKVSFRQGKESGSDVGDTQSRSDFPWDHLL